MLYCAPYPQPSLPDGATGLGLLCHVKKPGKIKQPAAPSSSGWAKTGRVSPQAEVELGIQAADEARERA